jgi:predicted phage tail protein
MSFKYLMMRPTLGLACLACLAGIFLFASCRSESDPPSLDADSVELPVSADGQNNAERLPKMVFDKEIHDFGTIKAGEKVSYSFRFVNKGGRDLMFNSEGKSGVQEKQVTVLANTMPNTITVRVKAEIIQP